MPHQSVLIYCLLLSVFAACGNPTGVNAPPTATVAANQEATKAAILKVLNDETIAAFNRDYAGWQEKWVHEPYVAKTYMNFADSSLTETLGWAAVDAFVVDYFAAHPEPDPLPTPLTDIDVRLYGTGAWVSYAQNDPARGRKRETRLLELVEGEWKIAGMQTVIYGEGSTE
ncbi:hypothetical protein [Neolewinella antarctica]|uniref:DUF4440 domain-containing protein n=1 Tax=Neolewinella antarctica TaxID=442734 RepID=A0ABX0XAF7_9BACT|nr:hypothetical protein [Neolewinella antarctica]NJC25803.1 hypothetical protein [Neolewinella antarctica]